jgi:C_GCAxxG_C_C family probable redox protein
MTIKEKASKNFKQGLNCSQSVIEAYSHASGLDPGTAKAVSVGFGGGMGRTQKTCGAVSGAIMAIGCKYYNGNDPSGSKEKAYAKTREFIEGLEKRHGSSDCISLLGVDLNTDEGKKEYRERNLSEKKCLKYVQDACDILEENL